jgi:enoyl-[acyl-carrier protein] reductase III
VERVVRTAGEEFGLLDVFVSNARSDFDRFYAPVTSMSLEQWQDAIDGQAREFLVGAREAATFMSDRIGRIVAITYTPGSDTGTWQPWAAMGAAKSAVQSLCRYFAVALAHRGICVNAVSPGLTDDSALNSLPPQAFEMVKQRCQSGWTPMRRMTTPRDIGDTVSLLCTAEAGFITGEVIHCDGGAATSLADLPLQLQQG